MKEYKRLFEDGADFNSSNEFGITPLMGAAKKGDASIVEFLSKHTININQEDNQGNSALYYATQSGNLLSVQILCENGAKITDFIYMYAVTTNKKIIVKYFDTQK